MSDRGSVLTARRGIGFGAGEPARFLVLSASALNDVLATVVVAPIAAGAAGGDTLAIPMGRRETGLTQTTYVDVAALGAVPRDRFDVRPVGRATAGTMAKVDQVLRTIFEIAP